VQETLASQHVSHKAASAKSTESKSVVSEEKEHEARTDVPTTSR
jgi:hypothetical protein